MKFGQTQIENWEYIMVLLLPRPVTFPTVSTRLLDENGTLLLEYNDVNFGTNPRLVLEDCQLLFGE